MKTTFLVLLSFILFFTKAAIAQFSGDWVYTTNGNAVTIVGYLGLGGALNVPSTINGLPVTRIGADVFHSFTGLTTITIPEGVVDIGNNAFAFCSSLTTVVLPESLTSIGHSSFYSCQRLASITIPINVTNIVEYGFSGCSGLTNITIWSSTLTMGMANFADCSSLISVFFMGNAPTITWDHTTFSGDDHATVYYIPGTTGWGATTFDGRPTQLWIPLPAITQQPLGVTTNRGATVTVTVSASSPFPISYQWTFNGTNISGATNSRFTITGITPERLGTYAVLLTNAYGAVTSSNAVLSLYAYTVNAHINGQGSVSVNPEQASYLDGTSVTVTAVPADGWAFVGWSGNLSGEINPATLLITGSNKSLTANFKPLWQFNATAGIGGTVSWTPQQINYLDGALITVTAVASNGFAFTGWSGVTNSPVNPLLLKLSGNAEVQAHFVAPARVDLSSLNQTYDGTARAVIATTTPPALALNLSYNGSSSPPTNAGIYTVIATVSDPVYRGSTTNTLVIGKATALVTLSGLSQSYDGTAKPVMVDTTPSNLWVSVIYDGSVRVPINAGNYTAVGTINNVNYQGSATNTLVIGKATALVTLSGLYQTYDGTAKPVTVNTTPSNVTVTVTYNGSVSIPINAGSYTVVGTVNNVNYQGSATNTLVIGKATALVTLSGLSQMYDGTAKPVTVSTTPSGLTVSVTYDGSVSIPINAGSYTVAGTVNNANYQGSAINTLVIGKATALVALIGLSQMYDGTAKPVTVSTTPSGLTVSVTYDGSVSIPINAGSCTVVAIVNNVNYQGSATNTLVIGKATALVALSGLSQMYDGTAKPVTVSTTPSGLTVSVTYDGSVSIPINAGSYTVAGTVNNANYQGSAINTLVIGKATALVALIGLSQMYDGTAKCVTFSTTPSNLLASLSYDWSSTCPSDVGVYIVIGTINDTNYLGSATNTLTIYAVAPVIVQHPHSQTVSLGSDVNFTVVATGAPLFFQWRKNGVDVSGATNSTFIITNVQFADAGAYKLVVSNSGGMATTEAVILTVVQPVSITGQPQSTNVNLGGTVSFTILAGGGDTLSYQWLRNATPIPGAISTSLTITNAQAADDADYSVLVSNIVTSASSTIAHLLVVIPPVITTQPLSRTNLAGTTASFSVTAAGTNPNYQWRKAGIDLMDATNSTLTLIGISEGSAGVYDAVVWNPAGWNVSTAATLTVLVPATIITSPTNESILLSNSLTFNVVAYGTGPLQYQWRKYWLPIQGATNNSYSIESVRTSDAGSYDVLVTNVVGRATSSNAMLIVLYPPSFLVQPSNSIVALDGTAAFSVVADGVPAPTYQWYLQGAPLPGCTNSGLYLTEVTATEAGTYHVVISNSCGYATSTAATLTVVLPALTLAEALDAPGFLWTTGGNSPWIPQTNVTSDGVDAAVSGTITNYQQSWVETVVNGPGQVTFMWKASSEFGFDLLTFVVNGVQQAQLSGETEWLQRTQSVSPGQHELRWVYSKDGSDSAGLDCGWLDQVKYVPEPGVAQPVYVLTSKVRQRDGLFQMDMLGEPGKTITVEASTNLSNWLPLVMITNWTGSSRFTDPDTAANPSRYYRLRTP